MKFLRPAGLVQDLSHVGFGERAKRFALIIDDLKVCYALLALTRVSLTQADSRKITFDRSLTSARRPARVSCAIFSVYPLGLVPDRFLRTFLQVSARRVPRLFSPSSKRRVRPLCRIHSV